MLERPLPHSFESEKAVLGAVILDNALIDQVEADLQPHDFYVRSHFHLYNAMLEMAHEGVEINPILVGEKLREQGNLEQVGGIAFISELTYGLPHFTNVKHYTRKIKDKSNKRKIINLANAITTQALEDSDEAEEVVRNFDAMMDVVREETTTEHTGFQSAIDIAPLLHQRLTDIKDGVSFAISTGLPLLDQATRGGGVPGELWVWSALTGGGKSALMKQIAQFCAKQGIPVGIVTAEMSDWEVMLRMLSDEAKVPAWTIQPNVLRQEQYDRLEQGLVKIASLPIYIDDRSTNIYEIRARVKSLVRSVTDKSQPIQDRKFVLFVDYLQLLEVKAEDFGRFVMTRAQEVAKVSRILKKLAKELNIWIFALAQFNRTANSKDETGNVKPEIHQLAESGGMEKDADLVGIIDMPEYVQGQPEREVGLRIGKNRNAPPLTLPYIFNGDYLNFRERDKPVVKKRDTRTELIDYAAKPAVSGTEKALPDTAAIVPDFDMENPLF
jgi:replicative DNA helicase